MLVFIGTEELGRVRDIIAVLRRAAPEVAAAVFVGVDGVRALPFLSAAFPVVLVLGEHDTRDGAPVTMQFWRWSKHERDDASMAFSFSRRRTLDVCATNISSSASSFFAYSSAVTNARSRGSARA